MQAANRQACGVTAYEIPVPGYSGADMVVEISDETRASAEAGNIGSQTVICEQIKRKANTVWANRIVTWDWTRRVLAWAPSYPLTPA